MRVVIETRISVYTNGSADDRTYTLNSTAETGDNPGYVVETTGNLGLRVLNDLQRTVAHDFPPRSTVGTTPPLAHQGTLDVPPLAAP